MTFQIYFHGDIRHSKGLAAQCREYAQDLQTEFPETHKFEVSVTKASSELYELHVHVVGKELSISSSSKNRGIKEAASDAFAKVQRQLRKRPI